MLVTIWWLGYYHKLEDGNEYPTAFYSKKLSDKQRAWSTIEKEAFAVPEALNRFRSWIFGYKIFIYSDHNPLSYLTESVPIKVLNCKDGL